MKKLFLGCLLTLGACFSTSFAQTDLPERAQIDAKSSVIEGEASNITITLIKNGEQMTSYNGIICMVITNAETNEILSQNQYTLPSDGCYDFKTEDQGTKTFQRGLEIKKAGKYYISVYDLLNDDNKISGNALIEVISKDANKEISEILVYNPSEGNTIYDESLNIIGSCAALPNSNVNIYIDDVQIDTPTRVTSDYDGGINYILSNISKGSHTLRLEIIDGLNNRKLGESKNIHFDYNPTSTELFKNIVFSPETGYYIGDTIDITVYTNEIAETVKIAPSDREGAIQMKEDENTRGIFRRNLFLSSTGEVNFSLEITSYKDSVQNYDNVKTIYVRDIPSVKNIVTIPHPTTQIVNVNWELENGPVYEYLINYGTKEDELNYEQTTTGTSFEFTSVPYDTTIYLKITPYGANGKGHGAASKTVQFIITKPVATCGNGKLEDGENCQNCPEDAGQCPITCGNGIIDEGEDCGNCPSDIGLDKCLVQKHSCTVQAINTRTQQIGENYFLLRDKVDNVSKYIVYSSTTPKISDRVKVYETTDTSYEYPFDKTSDTDQYMYYWIDGVCDDGEELQLESATKVQVGPTENFFLLVCMTLLIYFGIKIFRQTEEY